MDPDEYNMYKLQLEQIDHALISCPMGEEREELLLLKSNIEELLALSSNEEAPSDTSCSKDPLSNEFALFMAEMEKEGAVERSDDYSTSDNLEKLKDIEGMKCRAPHTHQWGHVAYHNAMVCSVVPENVMDINEIKVRVLFINPTHQEMLPCPYYYESDCKFPDDKCRFSHGEIVLYSSLQEYIEPKFDLLTTGSPVLAKQSNNLWYRAIIRKIYDEKCVVKFESNRKEVEVFLEHVFPLSNDENVVNGYESSEDERREEDRNEDVINMSLMITPSKEALGNWEQFTKGIGSKLMQKMGYVVGTGLGKNSDGRIDPVTAVILPSGKSLDHCMRLREEAGDDKDLFSVERKLKKLQKRQEIQSRKHYERESQKSNSDVFNFINQALAEGSNQNHKDRLDERQKLKKECSRNLNIKSLQIADNIRKIERDLEKLKDSLGRHTDSTSDIHLKLKDKLVYRQDQLKMYQAQATMIRNEQSLRSDKKKMTVF